MSEDNYGAERRDDSELDSGDEANPSESQINSLDESPKDSDEDEGAQGEMEIQQQEEDEGQRIKIIQEPTYEVSNETKITPPFLTKYEKARIIGVRATQISKNSPIYLTADEKDLNYWDPLYIAQKQLSEKKIPFIIRRYLPDSSFEDWRLADLRMLE